MDRTGDHDLGGGHRGGGPRARWWAAALPGRWRCWGHARTRRVPRGGGTEAELSPDRARCDSCRVTHVLLPAFCLPRRGYTVELVGSALLAGAHGRGHRQVAAELGVPADTVRGWLRGARRGAAWLTAQAASVAAGAGVGLCGHRGPFAWRGGSRTCWTRSGRPPTASPATGPRLDRAGRD